MNWKTAIWLFSFAVICLVMNALMVIGASWSTAIAFSMVSSERVDPYAIQSCLKLGMGGFSVAGVAVLIGAIVLELADRRKKS